MFRLILIAILVADLAWWWRADHLARKAGKPWLRAAIAGFMSIQLGLILWIFLSRWMGLAFPSPPTLVMTTVYLWHLLILPILIVAMVPWHGVRGLWAGARALLARQKVEGERPREVPPLSRRTFLTTAAVAAPPLATLALTGYSRFHLQGFRVRPLTVTLAALPRELDGLTIAHVSDLHVGTFTDDRLLRRIVDETSRLNADLVLLPGDLINNRLADLPAALDAVANMQARHGVMMCLGNHDLIEDGREFIRRSRERVNLLINEGATVRVRGGEVQVLGLGWARGEEPMNADVASVAKLVRPGAFPILMAHHPHAFDEAARQGIPLTLSGHTHGGQLMATEEFGFGPAMYRYWSGLYRQGDCATVVSNGVGHWYPVRVNAPAEIVHLTLRAG